MTKELTLEQAIALIQAAASPLQQNILSELKPLVKMRGKVICYDGDVELPELEVGTAVVIVNGNLNVTGNISDCDGEDNTLLIVLGNVKCKNFLTYSATFITGDLHVEHTLLGESANDCNIGGNLQARTIIEAGHWIIVQGEAKFQYLYDSHCKVTDRNGELKANLGDAEKMENVEQDPESYKDHSYVPLVDELQKYGNLDSSKAIEFIKNGGELFCKQ